MRTHFKALAVILPGMLATCGGPNPENCAGWSPGYMKAGTADYIDRNDPRFADWVIAHNEHGVSRKCWKGTSKWKLGF